MCIRDRSRTTFGFSLESLTRTQQLRFSADTQAVGEFGGGASDDFEFENSNVRLSFGQQGANSAIDFNARFSERDLDDTIVALEPGGGVGSGTLIIDNGNATILALGGGLDLGTRSSFGLELNASYFEEDFSGTTDPDLNDRDVISADATALFRFNQTQTGRALIGASRESEANQAFDTESSFFGVGIQGETRGQLNYTADILYDRSEFGPATEDGIGLDFGVSQQRPNGSIGADFSTRIDDEGRRTELGVRRAIDLPRGALGFRVGVVDQEGDSSLRPSGEISYERSGRSNRFVAALTQSPTVDSGVVSNNTRINVGYTQNITETSSFSADFAFVAVNEVNSPFDDDRATARFTYRRDLTRNWEFNTGYEFERESIDNGNTETSNTLFFNIRRDISFGF